MARVKTSHLIEQLRGAFDGLVFRQYGDKLVVSVKPDMSGRRFSPKQLEAQDRFKAASAWAKEVTSDPEVKALYAAVGRPKQLTAYQAAISDYSHPPTVSAIRTSAYRGRAGDVILVEAHKPAGVVRVVVELVSASGDVLEVGEARLRRSRWAYRVEASPPAGEAVVVRARAFDRAGNEGVGERELALAVPAVEAG